MVELQVSNKRDRAGQHISQDAKNRKPEVTPRNSPMEQSIGMSLAPPDIVALQRHIGNAAVSRLLGHERAASVRTEHPPRVVQRKAIYTVGTDVISTNAYAKLTAGGETKVNELLAEQKLERSQLLRQKLGANEELVIIGHGDGHGRIEGFDAENLLGHLMEMGFDPSLHKGTVNLYSCFSGTKLQGPGVVFAEAFSQCLQTKGFSNPVVGYKGYVLPFGDKTKVVPLLYKDKFDGLKIALEKCKESPGLLKGAKDAMAEAQLAAQSGNTQQVDYWMKQADLWMTDLMNLQNLLNFASVEVEKVGLDLNQDVMQVYQSILPPPVVSIMPAAETVVNMTSTANSIAQTLPRASTGTPSTQTRFLNTARELADAIRQMAQILQIDDLTKASEALEDRVKS